MKYIFDTNVYISAFRGYYSPDICPSYWDVLKELGERGTIQSPKQVKEEIEARDDDLCKWARTKNKCFLARDIEGITPFFIQVKEAYKKIKGLSVSSWEKRMRKHYILREEPISDEDMFVVATACFYKHHFPNQITVVTKEELKSTTYKLIRLPHLCDEMEIPWMNDFDFIREFGIEFEAKLQDSKNLKKEN